MFLPTHPSTLAPFSESVQVCSVESFCGHSWTSWQNVHSLVTWPYTHLSSWCKAISISLVCQHWVLCKSLAYSYPENYQAIFKATRTALFLSNKNHPRATAQLFLFQSCVFSVYSATACNSLNSLVIPLCRASHYFQPRFHEDKNDPWVCISIC